MTDARSLPQPIKMTLEEGGEWIPFLPVEEYCKLSREERFRRNTAHSIMFDDGSVFDMVSGWRTARYCPCCGRRK